MTSFLIAESSTDSLSRLTGDEQKAAKTTAFDLQINPAQPGLQFHKLDKARDKSFWSVRVTKHIRLIVHRSEASLLLCYVDHHDKAYAWAERRKLERHPTTGAAQFVEIRETVKEIVVPVTVTASPVRKPRSVAPRVIGIDDWAWRRNQRYGTIICDLERRRTIALLPDREPATAEAWLANQQQIEIVARDRSGGYAMAVAKALPEAAQVADRWHLMENASRAFLDAVRKSMRQIRRAIGAATINPDLLTAAERIQYEGYLRREEVNSVILELAKKGTTIKEIVRRTGHSRGLVRKVLRGQHSDVFRVRESSLEVYLNWLDEQWAGGQRNGAELWRRLKQQGFRGCLRVVTEWASRRRQAEKADGALSRTPSSRTIARLMTIGRDGLSKAETVTVAAIESGVPLLVEAREIIAAFQAMTRKKSLADLERWLERARTSLVASFANGVIKDQAAVSAAITSLWSNGQTEGQITKLKLVKRQMYGRGKIDLLQARVIGPD